MATEALFQTNKQKTTPFKRQILSSKWDGLLTSREEIKTILLPFLDFPL